MSGKISLDTNEMDDLYKDNLIALSENEMCMTYCGYIVYF
jgi:hypothetical protein